MGLCLSRKPDQGPLPPALPPVDEEKIKQGLSPVYLHIYDLLVLNYTTSKFGMGVYHTGVQVYHDEYCFSGHNQLDGKDGHELTGLRAFRPPTDTSWIEDAIYKESVIVGYTDLSEVQVVALFGQMKKEFVGPSYNVLGRNCNHFTARFIERLLHLEHGEGDELIPHYVSRIVRVANKVRPCLPSLLTQDLRHQLPPRYVYRDRHGEIIGTSSQGPTPRVRAPDGTEQKLDRRSSKSQSQMDVEDRYAAIEERRKLQQKLQQQQQMLQEQVERLQAKALAQGGTIEPSPQPEAMMSQAEFVSPLFEPAISREHFEEQHSVIDWGRGESNSVSTSATFTASTPISHTPSAHTNNNSGPVSSRTTQNNTISSGALSQRQKQQPASARLSRSQADDFDPRREDEDQDDKKHGGSDDQYAQAQQKPLLSSSSSSNTTTEPGEVDPSDPDNLAPYYVAPSTNSASTSARRRPGVNSAFHAASSGVDVSEILVRQMTPTESVRYREWENKNKAQGHSHREMLSSKSINSPRDIFNHSQQPLTHRPSLQSQSSLTRQGSLSARPSHHAQNGVPTAMEDDSFRRPSMRLSQAQPGSMTSRPSMKQSISIQNQPKPVQNGQTNHHASSNSNPHSARPSFSAARPARAAYVDRNQSRSPSPSSRSTSASARNKPQGGNVAGFSGYIPPSAKAYDENQANATAPMGVSTFGDGDISTPSLGQTSARSRQQPGSARRQTGNSFF